jgi:hypothetical protein
MPPRRARGAASAWAPTQDAERRMKMVTLALAVGAAVHHDPLPFCAPSASSPEMPARGGGRARDDATLSVTS